eukprot:TRINITY_DN11845_c0_g3_i2.p1 TRINITY_DN11845_c0_g3~~TRINITY_DN11845_c0_g3_i2.p1  ORF type:complete len:600 (-),score=87.47 TRINITY_DN11845_c0_g3_i2:707-2506(-)
MGSEQTMKVAEELYQSGFISYPRTETDSFPASMDLHAAVADQQGHPTWGAYAQRLLTPAEGLWQAPSNGGHDDGAHPPISPTRFSAGEQNWTADHARIYELVVRHFLACVSQPAVGFETVATIDIAGESFKARGLMITARNYLEIYRYDSWGASTLPVFQPGQQFIPTELTLRQSTTEPPPLLSEADLLGLMDQSGIGTDATMHDHIKKQLERGYATKDVATTRFTPTPLGEALVKGYDSMGYELWKPHLRALMERDMRCVSDGTKSKEQVLADTLRQTKACFLDARQQQEKLIEAMDLFFERSAGGGQQIVSEEVRPCPVCRMPQAKMILRSRQGGGLLIGCSAYPQCRNAIWLPSAVEQVTVLQDTCPNCQPGPVKRIRMKLRRAETPLHFDTDVTGCIGGCDARMRDLLEALGGPGGVGRPQANGAGPRPAAQNGAAARGRGPQGRGRGGPAGGGAAPGPQGGAARPNNHGGGGPPPPAGGQGTCFRCGQDGHWSSSCPNGAGAPPRDGAGGAAGMSGRGGGGAGAGFPAQAQRGGRQGAAAAPEGGRGRGGRGAAASSRPRGGRTASTGEPATGRGRGARGRGTRGRRGAANSSP